MVAIPTQPTSLRQNEQFGIAHYAGPVFYDVEGMLEKTMTECTKKFMTASVRQEHPSYRRWDAMDVIQDMTVTRTTFRQTYASPLMPTYNRECTYMHRRVHLQTRAGRHIYVRGGIYAFEKHTCNYYRYLTTYNGINMSVCPYIYLLVRISARYTFLYTNERMCQIYKRISIYIHGQT